MEGFGGLAVLRSIVYLLMIVVPASSSFAQSIGIHESSCGSCNFDVPLYTPTLIVISLHTGGVVSGLRGAEFKVVGMPTGWFTFNRVVPFSCDLDEPCNPLTPAGAVYNLPDCLRGDCIELFLAMIFATTEAKDVVLSVVSRRTSTTPDFDCPLITLCNRPAYTKVCVTGGRAYLNSNLDCEVAVEDTSWDQVKSLYR